MRLLFDSLWLRLAFSALLISSLGQSFGVQSAQGNERASSSVTPARGWAPLQVRIDLTGHPNESIYFGRPDSKSLRTIRFLDQASGKSGRWESLALGEFVEKVLEKASVETRSEIDLVFFEGPEGSRLALARGFLRKFPEISLGLPVSSHPAGDLAPKGWSPLFPGSLSRYMKEGLAPGMYAGRSVSSLVLTNSRQQFSNWVLQRRTDPLAVRGEGVYLQSCVGCHGSQGMEQSPSVPTVEAAARLVTAISERKALLDKHSVTFNSRQVLSLEERDHRSLIRYFDALVAEKSVNLKSTVSPSVSGDGDQPQSSSAEVGEGSSSQLSQGVVSAASS